MDTLDPHQRPPGAIRDVYKRFQKLKPADVDSDTSIVDLERNGSAGDAQVKVIGELHSSRLNGIFRAFAGDDALEDLVDKPVPVYEHAAMAGLQITPSLLPPSIQTTLLSRLLHRDLSNPAHLTNIHTHYTLSYPPSSQSLFSHPPSHPTPLATPLDPTVHKPLPISQLLTKKLRWTTLGGQYDWTSKRYPSAPPPAFPPDIGALLEAIWPSTRPEAAIVNLYSPGDTLSIHRDVSESSARGLVSISLGCDAVFVIGNAGAGEEGIMALRLRSGSAVYMSGESRFAWHGVPQIVAGTCPAYLREWPAGNVGWGAC
ncbi:hypothetical protein EJ04DRAFT_588821 [Polyplosphaeria fusca]|uniref:Alpha-ketoglutarate-dependent dioxygenase AlkB-like domain-containing protein n=1 Tax=Polyplosphaeria fusca TaxID=682080 RepID=A0A9P4QMW2_9PLEO|nr:hypothetical protein EJ04DRAFT_588821 [Polyplosphaeria fusca]